MEDKKQIYFDNACTSFPKAPKVAQVVYDYLTKDVSNVNRSSYKKSTKVEEIIYETRLLIKQLFNAENEQNVIWTKNITESLNFIIKGLFKKGDNIIVSSIEHNAVMRPLVQMSDIISFDRIKADKNGYIEIDNIKKLIKPNTKAIIINSASNVNGIKMPLKQISELVKDSGLLFILDSAQLAGFENIDMKELNIDCLCFTGHKSLLGPQGIGGFVLSNRIVDKIEPLISGGTGSMSDKETIPDFMPDKFEAGTLNVPGIYGLNASLKYINQIGIDNIKKAELKLLKYFLDGISILEDKKLIKIINNKNIDNMVPVVSITTYDKDLSDIAYRLDEEYNIMTRVGLHCAPIAHKTFGTFPTGTIRFSFGHNNTIKEIDYAIDSLNKLLH